MSLSSINLDAFFVCAQLGHFTKAAEKLHITQSALSQRIHNLEQDLETALFIRDRTGIRLTAAGLELLRYCQARDSIEGEVLNRIRGSQTTTEPSGVIRIGGFSSVMRSVVLPALAPILTRYPQIKIELLSRELDDLPGLLKSSEIDYMILERDLGRDDIETHLLGEERNVLIEKKNYRGPEIYLDHTEVDQITFRYLKVNASKKRAKIERRFLGDVYGLIEGVKLGLGRAVIPIHLLKNESGLSIVDSEHVLTIPVVLHYYAQPFYSQLHKEVVKALTERCKF